MLWLLLCLHPCSFCEPIKGHLDLNIYLINFLWGKSDRGPFYGLNQVQLVMAPWVVVNALTSVSAANHCKYVLCKAVVALE